MFRCIASDMFEWRVCVSFRLYKKLAFICQTQMAEIHRNWVLHRISHQPGQIWTYQHQRLHFFSHLLRRVPCCQNTDMLHGITYWRLFVMFSCSLPTGVQTPGSYFEATLCQPLIPRRSYTLACEAFAEWFTWAGYSHQTQPVYRCIKLLWWGDDATTIETADGAWTMRSLLT